MSRVLFLIVVVVASFTAACAAPDVNEGEGEEGEGEAAEGEGEAAEGEGEGEGECFNDVFAAPAVDGPVVVYVDGFRVGSSAACAAGELYEVYFELEAEVPFVDVVVSFEGAVPVPVESVDADFDGHRGDACGPAATTPVRLGVQVSDGSGASQPVCGTAL
jgi:hypothetical protein